MTSHQAQPMPESPEPEPELILESPVNPVVEAQSPIGCQPAHRLAFEIDTAGR